MEGERGGAAVQGCQTKEQGPANGILHEPGHFGRWKPGPTAEGPLRWRYPPAEIGCNATLELAPRKTEGQGRISTVTVTPHPP